jgi:hypothetical protein
MAPGVTVNRRSYSPRVSSAQRITVSPLRNPSTMDSSFLRRFWPVMAVATITSHRSLKAIVRADLVRQRELESKYGRLRPFIQRTAIGCPGASAVLCPPNKSKSATRSSSGSSATPVVQLQKPILARKKDIDISSAVSCVATIRLAGAPLIDRKAPFDFPPNGMNRGRHRGGRFQREARCQSKQHERRSGSFAHPH